MFLSVCLSEFSCTGSFILGDKENSGSDSIQSKNVQRDGSEKMSSRGQRERCTAIMLDQWSVALSTHFQDHSLINSSESSCGRDIASNGTDKQGMPIKPADAFIFDDSDDDDDDDDESSSDTRNSDTLERTETVLRGADKVVGIGAIKDGRENENLTAIQSLHAKKWCKNMQMVSSLFSYVGEDSRNATEKSLTECIVSGDKLSVLKMDDFIGLGEHSISIATARFPYKSQRIYFKPTRSAPCVQQSC